MDWCGMLDKLEHCHCQFSLLENIPCASGHAGGGVCGQEIMCGDVMVRTGDVVFGDDDGVVVIQREALASVIEKAEAKKKLDEERIEEILKRIF